MFHCYKKCPAVVHAPKSARGGAGAKSLSSAPPSRYESPSLRVDYDIADYSDDAVYMNLDYCPPASVYYTELHTQVQGGSGSSSGGAAASPSSGGHFSSQGAQLASIMHVCAKSADADADADADAEMMAIATSSESCLMAASMPGTAAAAPQRPTGLRGSVGVLSFEQHLALAREELQDDPRPRRGLVDQHGAMSHECSRSSHPTSVLSRSDASGSNQSYPSSVADAISTSIADRCGALTDEDLYVWIQAARLLSLSSSSTAVTAHSEDDVAEESA